MRLTIELDPRDRTSVRLVETHAFAAGDVYNPLVLRFAEGADPATLRAYLRRRLPSGSMQTVSRTATLFSRVSRIEVQGSMSLSTSEMAAWYADAEGSGSDGTQRLNLTAQGVLEVYDAGRLLCRAPVPVILRAMSSDLLPGQDGRDALVSVVRQGPNRRTLVRAESGDGTVTEAYVYDGASVSVSGGSDSDGAYVLVSSSSTDPEFEGSSVKLRNGRDGADGRDALVEVSDAGGAVLFRARSGDGTETSARLEPPRLPNVDPEPMDFSASDSVDMELGYRLVSSAGVKAAVDAHPTKAEIEAGWWSEWTVKFHIGDEWVGIDDPRVQEEIASASLAYDGDDGWRMTLINSDGGVRVLSPFADARDENATRLGFSILGGDERIRATRHRVAAPVPTKPEDIGAQPAGSYATGAQGARADAALSRAEAEAGFTEWRYSGIPSGYEIHEPLEYVADQGRWEMVLVDESESHFFLYVAGSEDDTEISLGGSSGIVVTATRTRLPTAADIRTRVSDMSDADAYVSQVDATYLSVGWRFSPELRSGFRLSRSPHSSWTLSEGGWGWVVVDAAGFNVSDPGAREISFYMPSEPDVHWPATGLEGQLVVATRVDPYPEKADASGLYVEDGSESDTAVVHLKEGVSVEMVTRHQQLTPVYSPQTPTFSEWVTEPAGFAENIAWENGLWCIPGNENAEMPNAADINATSLVFDSADKFTATRTRTDVIGYTLGAQTDKPLQPQGDYLTPQHQSLAGLMPKYSFETATVGPGNTLTVAPYTVATLPSASAISAAFSVAMGALPAGAAGKARDAMLVIDCTSLTEGEEPTITWDSHFHPRTDTETDFACVAGVRNVYYISEYATGEFAVGGWTETEGGYAPNGGSGT